MITALGIGAMNGVLVGSNVTSNRLSRFAFT